MSTMSRRAMMAGTAALATGAAANVVAIAAHVAVQFPDRRKKAAGKG